MKKTGRIILCLICVLLISGCKKDDTAGSKLKKDNSVDSVIQSEIEKEGSSVTTEAATEATTEESTTVEATTDTATTDTAATEAETTEDVTAESQNINGMDGVDIDLTEMSSDMVYATIYQMLVEPDSYIGKTVRIKGNYYASWYDKTAKYYHYAIIQDAMACCAQGMEFELSDESLTYPDDYPEENAEITIVGTFETYVEEDENYMYCKLTNAVIE